jgi:alkylated DNA repair protein alkB homolog 6
VAPYFVASANDESPALIPNHLLINEYEPHQGIMAHTDGPAYAPRTATISLGCGAVLLQFTPTTAAGGDDNDDCRPEQETFQVVLQGHGSLVLFEDAAYSSLQHSIMEHCTVEHADATCRNADEGATVRRDYRISITIRHKF